MDLYIEEASSVILFTGPIRLGWFFLTDFIDQIRLLYGRMGVSSSSCPWTRQLPKKAI